jgi:FkbM family methyltransferase
LQLRRKVSFIWTKRAQRYFILPGDYVGTMNAQLGCYEREEIEVLRWIVNCCLTAAEQKTAAFLDVGAHLGNYSIEIGPSFGSIIAVEASPVLSKVLWANLLWNRISAEDAVVLDKAVSNQPGLISFEHNTAGNLGGSKIGDGTRSATSASSTVFTVATVSLQEIGRLALQRSSSVKLIKLDVEGHEIAALESGAAFIQAEQPILQVEVSPENLQAFEKFLQINMPGSLCYVVTHGGLPGQSKWASIGKLFSRTLDYQLVPISMYKSAKRLRALIVIPAWAIDSFANQTK